ncbi:acyl carrier protein, mitochondrial isoform X2 [Hyposmocoma kahamanoa]|uniref:acyl carrier protein, mitochondrial isoform X2 n=1 Tax=Hyposmocoma kahamanoa TaxID=1477025 RepID=UPI000E6D7DFA|nr:acyl carrier protein, mitochondrial isoform X2 [Hyposmocoma kahamanoa]
MAAVNFVRSAFNGLLRKPTVYKTPVVCRLSTVALQQKYHAVNIAVKVNNKCSLQNGVSQRIRHYQQGPPKPSLEEVEERVFKVCKAYDKLSDCQLNPDSHFINDLGLDSLDHVEVIMAMEDEFGFEIPDGDAERLMKPKDIIQYVADKQDCYD